MALNTEGRFRPVGDGDLVAVAVQLGSRSGHGAANIAETTCANQQRGRRDDLDQFTASARRPEELRDVACLPCISGGSLRRQKPLMENGAVPTLSITNAGGAIASGP